MTKKFKIPNDQMKQLIPNMGGCFATDEILVVGKKVGYMYREKPDYEADSGWRFLSGDEDDEYLDQIHQSGIYDVNTIANYDPAIIPYLDSPEGFAFYRIKGSDQFKKVKHVPVVEEDEEDY